MVLRQVGNPCVGSLMLIYKASTSGDALMHRDGSRELHGEVEASEQGLLVLISLIITHHFSCHVETEWPCTGVGRCVGTTLQRARLLATGRP